MIIAPLLDLSPAPRDHRLAEAVVDLPDSWRRFAKRAPALGIQSNGFAVGLPRRHAVRTLIAMTQRVGDVASWLSIALGLIDGEAGRYNPGCRTPWDGILDIATCLSVGYDSVFPTTPPGHDLAAPVGSLGPALAGMAFDPPAAETRAEITAARAETAEVNRAILARLDDIVRLLGERAAP